MALISCPECGKEISDSSAQCIHCGYVLKAGNVAKEKKPLDKKVIIGIIVAAVVVVLIVGALVVKNSIIPSNNYKVAEQALEAEDFDGAASQFAELGDFKDSKDRVKQCYYEKGKSLMAKKSYSAAIKAFEDSDNYQDASSQIDKCEAKLEEEQAAAAHQAVIDKLKEVSESCIASGTSLSSDGLSLMIDAKNKDDLEALLDVYTAIEVLSLPDSLIDDMSHTTAMMGKQSQTCGDYEVSWSYHPDNGLDVLIKVIQ